MKFKWIKSEASDIYGDYKLVDDNDNILLNYGIWDTCVIDMMNGGSIKRQAVINELIDLIAPHINAEMASRETGLIYKDVINLFEAKIEELVNKDYEKLNKNNEAIKSIKVIETPNTTNSINNIIYNKNVKKHVDEKINTISIHNMQLHDIKVINNNLKILRVSGGWIYNRGDNPSSQTQCFVPYSNEFQGL